MNPYDPTTPRRLRWKFQVSSFYKKKTMTVVAPSENAARRKAAYFLQSKVKGSRGEELAIWAMKMPLL